MNLSRSWMRDLGSEWSNRSNDNNLRSTFRKGGERKRWELIVLV